MSQPSNKERALARINKLIEDEGPIHQDSPQHTGWYRSATRIIAKVFGDQSTQLKELTEARGLSVQKAMLISMVDEIEDDWGDQGPERPVHDTQKAISSRVNTTARSQDPSGIFVVHGRNLGLRDALFRFLRSIGLRPLEWSQAIAATGKTSPYIGEVLDAAFSQAQAVVVLMTPDDEARLRTILRKPDDPRFESQLTFQARPNVLFEAGMSMGRSSERTILIQVGQIRPFSDIGGRHVLQLDNSSERRQELAHRLLSAGCPVDLTGTDWHREGDFSVSAEPADEDSR